MLSAKKDLIRKELEEGTGAKIAMDLDHTGLRTGLHIWFADLEKKNGPVAVLSPYGLKGHLVNLAFGNFSAEILRQINNASQEDIQLARALVASISPQIEIEILGQDKGTWKITDGKFRLTAKIRNLEYPHDDRSIISTCRDVIVPLMAAMAELIGYDVIEEDVHDNASAYEGAISHSTVNRRERNPRNRLLCIRIYGEKCFACGCEPTTIYGNAGSIIEVHHLEPISLLTEPRCYNPSTDLVPLCPNCHRAVHTRRPIPLTVEELRTILQKLS
jgi:5-methylcytosine-specific restriction protein A